jgi:uncharacterized protein (TIGR03437 family)
VTPISATQYARFTQPIRTSATAVITTAPTVDIIDTSTGATRSSVPALEGPLTPLTSTTTAATVAGRTMAIDSTGTNAYILTISGLSVIPLTVASAANRPTLNQKATVNIASLSTAIAPNTLVSISGKNLAAAASAPTSGTLPTILGGVCVTLGSTPIPLLMTSPTQINAEIPPQLASGSYQVIVHEIGTGLASSSQSTTVSTYAPAVLIDSTGNIELYRLSDNKQITKDNPAVRDEELVMYATGLGVPKGAQVTVGTPIAAGAVIPTATVQVFFGNPLWVQAAIIVDSSDFTPGMIGVYSLHLRVPGFHISGSALPVMLKIGTATSPTTGSAVPTVAVN